MKRLILYGIDLLNLSLILVTMDIFVIKFTNFFILYLDSIFKDAGLFIYFYINLCKNKPTRIKVEGIMLLYKITEFLSSLVNKITLFIFVLVLFYVYCKTDGKICKIFSLLWFF